MSVLPSPVNFDSLEPLIQDLLLIIYKSKEGYYQAVVRHPAEPIIIFYNRMAGDPTIPYTVALELGMVLIREEPLDLDGYLYTTLKEYLQTAATQIPKTINGISISLERAISMTPEAWNDFMLNYHPDTNIEYDERTDFIMQTYYILEVEESKEELGELTARDTPFQYTKTMNEEREDVA